MTALEREERIENALINLVLAGELYESETAYFRAFCETYGLPMTADSVPAYRRLDDAIGNGAIGYMRIDDPDTLSVFWALEGGYWRKALESEVRSAFED